MPWYKEAWEWTEKHPYWVAGGVFAVGVVAVLLWPKSAPSGPALTFQQQLALNKEQYAGQRSLITAQNAPALAQSRSQTASARAAASAQTAQTRIAANAQTAQTKIGASSQNLATTLDAALGRLQANLGSTDALTQYGYNFNANLAQTLAQAYGSELSANAATMGVTNDELDINPPAFPSMVTPGGALISGRML